MIRVIDIETTGMDPTTDAIVELAAIDLGKGGDFHVAVDTLVNPGRPIPPEASAVHGIIDEDVAGAPSAEAVLAQAAGSDWYVAHNAAFEQGWLAGLGGEWICTMKCALRVWGDNPEFPGAGNQALRYWLGLLAPLGVPREGIVPHRALGDVLVTGAIFFELLRVAPFPQLARWSSEPAVYPRLTFGKHRGMLVAEAPADYLQWLATGKHDMDDDWRHTAKLELDTRQGAGVRGVRHVHG